MRISNSFYIIILTLCFFLSFVAKAKENSYLWKKIEEGALSNNVAMREGNNRSLPLFEEFKSYNTETWSKIANDKGFIKQFESYLQVRDLHKIEDLSYVIKTKKANVDEVKQAFKELFKNKRSEFFEIIKKNKNLSESLDIDNISDLTNEKISDIVEHIVKAQ